MHSDCITQPLLDKREKDKREKGRRRRRKRKEKKDRHVMLWLFLLSYCSNSIFIASQCHRISYSAFEFSVRSNFAPSHIEEWRGKTKRCNKCMRRRRKKGQKWKEETDHSMGHSVIHVFKSHFVCLFLTVDPPLGHQKLAHCSSSCVINVFHWFLDH